MTVLARAMFINMFDFVNYILSPLYDAPLSSFKSFNRMRSYLAGNHEFTVGKKYLDFALVEHEVHFEFFTVSFKDLSYDENNL